QVAKDQLGDFYRHDLTAAGVEFITPAADVGQPTARSMFLVTPDGHRTMNTFLGAAQHLPRQALDEQQISNAAILYLEGYLWDPETPRYAMVRAIEIAREAGRKVAFTLSDMFCVDRHRDGFNQLLDQRRIDILFANQAEVEALAGVAHFESAVAAIAPKVETLVVTRSEDGALAVRNGERADIEAEPIDELVDTTGAGDLFAAGFLLGTARRKSLEASLRLGAVSAAEVIQLYGARPEKDLRALAGELAA
ncbi:MAG: adenosine kinase, partial [Sphingomonas sp.]|nr:adenosine kinase [Sphingomonas sp.]